jgi:hypothetical protein
MVRPPTEINYKVSPWGHTAIPAENLPPWQGFSNPAEDRPGRFIFENLRHKGM